MANDNFTTINASDIKPGFLVRTSDSGNCIVDDVTYYGTRVCCTMHTVTGVMVMGVYRTSEAVVTAR